MDLAMGELQNLLMAETWGGSGIYKTPEHWERPQRHAKDTKIL